MIATVNAAALIVGLRPAADFLGKTVARGENPYE
jgi:hypothetical protein